MFKKYIYIFAVVVIAISLVSCSDDNSTSPDTSLDTSKLTGNWVVTYYWDDDKEETYKFTGNSFSFLANGTVSVTVSNSTFPGVWSSGIDDSKAKLYLIFASPEHLEEISDDWHVVEQTDTKIRLADESGGDGSTDYLTFERQ